MGSALSTGKHPLIDSSLVFPAPPSSYSCSSDGLLLLRSRFAITSGSPAAVPAFLVVPSPQSHLKLAAALRTARLAAAAAEAAVAAAAAAGGLPPQQQQRRRSNIEGICASPAAVARTELSDGETERQQQLFQQLEQRRKELQQHMLVLQQLQREQRQQRVLRRRQTRRALTSQAEEPASTTAEAEGGEAEAAASVVAAAALTISSAADTPASQRESFLLSTSSEAGEASAAAASDAVLTAGKSGSYWDTEATGGGVGSDYCILYFHGNACDANMVRGWLQVVADEVLICSCCR